MTDFNAGDRVRTYGNIWGRHEGKEGVVTDRLSASGQQFMRLEGSDIDWAFNNSWPIELVEAANVAESETRVVVDIPGDYESVEAEEFVKPATDAINPPHYQGFSNGAQVIDITEHLSLCAGTAIKYLARAGKKDPSKHVEDLEKAAWYVSRELGRVKALNSSS